MRAYKKATPTNWLSVPKRKIKEPGWCHQDRI